MIIDFTPQKEKKRAPFLVRFMTATALSVAAIFLSAVAWAMIGLWSESVSLAAGLIVGMGIAAASLMPFAPINLVKGILLFFPVIVATILSLMLGEYLLGVLLVMREVGRFSEAWSIVASDPGAVFNSEWGAAGLILGVFGALIGYFGILRNT